MCIIECNNNKIDDKKANRIFLKSMEPSARFVDFGENRIYQLPNLHKHILCIQNDMKRVLYVKRHVRDDKTTSNMCVRRIITSHELAQV